MSPDEIKKIIAERSAALDASFPTLEIYAYCITEEALLVGAKHHNSMWGQHTIDIFRLHKHATDHIVYLGPTLK